MISRKIIIVVSISFLFSHVAEAQQAPARQQPSGQPNANSGLQPAKPQANGGLPKQSVPQGLPQGMQQAAVTQATAAQAAAGAAPTAAGSEIPWLRSATEAAIQSQATGKPILVYVRSKNCH